MAYGCSSTSSVTRAARTATGTATPGPPMTRTRRTGPSGVPSRRTERALAQRLTAGLWQRTSVRPTRRGCLLIAHPLYAISRQALDRPRDLPGRRSGFATQAPTRVKAGVSPRCMAGPTAARPARCGSGRSLDGRSFSSISQAAVCLQECGKPSGELAPGGRRSTSAPPREGAAWRVRPRISAGNRPKRSSPRRGGRASYVQSLRGCQRRRRAARCRRPGRNMLSPSRTSTTPSKTAPRHLQGVAPIVASMSHDTRSHQPRGSDGPDWT
jgi:hypothetical protein